MGAVRPESKPVPRVAVLALGGIGGSSSAAAEVALALAQAGGDPALLGARPVPRLAALPGERNAPRPQPRWVEAAPGAALAEALGREHRSRPFDLVHVHFAGPHLPIALEFAHRAGLPMALTLHGSDAVAESDRRALASLAAACSGVAVPSEWLRKQCSDGIDNVQVIPNFLDCARWTRPEPRNRDKPADGIPKIIFAGHLELWKGPDVLLEALELLPPARLEVHVLGGGSLAASLAARAPRGVRFLGPTPLGPAALHAVDLAVVPSRRESFGMVALEALATGCPLVASAVGGLEEVVGAGDLVGGESPVGQLVAPGDPVALAEAIQRAFADRDRTEELAELGQARARERYDRASGLARHLAFYARLL